MSQNSLRSLQFFINGEPGALITISETQDGKLNFKIDVADVGTNAADKADIADLRGLFFTVADESLLAGLSVTGQHVAEKVISANSVTKVNNDVTMSGEVGKQYGPFDVGIEFGSQGMSKDDIQHTEFTLSSSKALTLDLVLQQNFGVRMTSVSLNGQGREESLKLGATAPSLPTHETPGSEDPTDGDPGTEPPGTDDPGSEEPGTEDPGDGVPGGEEPSPEEPSEQPVPGISYDDLIEAGDGNDTIHGGLGNDEMQGEGGDDLIVGGQDNGTLTWGGGLSVTIGDNLYGNDGNDTFVFSKGDGVDLIWDFQPGKDVIKLAGYNQSDITGVMMVGAVANRITTGDHQKIALIFDKTGDAIIFNDFPAPSSGDIAIQFADGSTMSSARLLELAKARPVVSGPLEHPVVASPTAGGSAKSLDLYGSNDQDTLIGAAGDDRLYGNEGINGLNGHEGNDQIFGGNVRDIMLGEEGDDVSYGNGGDDLIIGGSGSDKLYGAGGVDVIYGDSGGDADVPALLTTYQPAFSAEKIQVETKVVNKWHGGFQGEITITATESVSAWNLSLRSKFDINDLWGAKVAGEHERPDTGVIYTLDNMEWNGSLAAGQTATIGFIAQTGIDGDPDVTVLLDGLAVVKDDLTSDSSYTGGEAGQIYRLYQAAFDRQPDQEGLNYWIREYTEGRGDLTWAALNFIGSEEFAQTYGSTGAVTDETFLTLLYANVLGRAPDAQGKVYWMDELARGFERAQLLASFSESAENKVLVADATWFI
jgi:Ca2+-binding RTX toxin-like protein